MTMVGYPAADVGAMYEAESARIWEAMNMPTDTELLKLSAKSLGYAIEDFDTSCDLVNEAAEMLVDTPEGDQVASILSEMEVLLKSMKDLRDKWRAGK